MIVLDDPDDPPAVLNGAIFQVFNVKPAGTGILKPFLRIHDNGTSGNGVEQGYNTGYRGAGFPDFDQKTDPNYTRNLTLGAVPVANVGSTSYREFLLDLNEPGGSKADISLNELHLFAGAAADGFSTNFAAPASFGGFTLLYDLDSNEDNTAILTDLFSGSGSTDVRILIPESSFVGRSASDYLYFYAEFTQADGSSQGGFEEFAPGQVPEPASFLIWGMLGVAFLAWPHARSTISNLGFKRQ
ncbi:MAG: hypothetical protein HYS13_24430 [Planctomycetia bacterium]|nr:hypothetical protein [Planctomycetia bacterium]